MSKYACTDTTYTRLKVPRKCSSALILPFHSQGRFGSAIHHNSKSFFRLGRCNCINALGVMEVRKWRPYDVFLAAPWVQMWRKNITSESRRTYEIGSLHYFPVNRNWLHQQTRSSLLSPSPPPLVSPLMQTSLNITTKLTTLLCQVLPSILSPVTVFVNKQENKVWEALRRVFMVAGCLYFSQQCRERKLNYPEWRH